MSDLIDHYQDDTGAHGRREARTRSGLLAAGIVVAMLAVGALSSCAAGGRGFGVRAAVDAGAPAAAGSAAAATGTWAAHQVRVVILARGDAGWPTAVQGATVRAFDPSTSTLHEATTGPDGAVAFQSRGPLELWVKLSEDARPEVITWAPKPADDVGNQVNLVHVLGAAQ